MSGILEYQYPGFQEFEISCEDIVPLEENEYKIIHLKEKDFPFDPNSDKYNVYKDLPELKNDNVLKRITLNFTYFSDINSAYIKEETIFKEIKVVEGLEIENIDIKDEYAQNTLNCGVNSFDIISLTDCFYLSVVLENYCDDNFRFLINFYSPILGKSLSCVEINEKRSIKKIFKFQKFEPGTSIKFWDDLIKISWESLDMKAKGNLEIKESLEGFFSKIFVCPLKIEVEMKSCQSENDVFVITQYQPLELVARFFSQENIELTVSLIVKKSLSYKQKDEKFAKEEIFYEGKKDFNLRIDNSSGSHFSENISVIFLNSNLSYSVCFRCVDKVKNKVYLFKNPHLIYVKKA